MSKQLTIIAEVIFFMGFWEPIFLPITKFVTNFSLQLFIKVRRSRVVIVSTSDTFEQVL